MSEEMMALAPTERRRARQRAYYWAHREEIRQQRAHHQTIDKAAHAAHIRKYRHSHREQNLAVQRAYRAKNRDHILELERRYRERNRDRIRAARCEYRSS